MMPMQNSCIAPMKTITHMVDAQPATGSPKHRRRTMMTTSMIAATNAIPIPDQDAMLSGTSEKLMMPSKAYFSSFQKFHFVSPATRSTF